MLRFLLCVAVGMFVCSDVALAKGKGKAKDKPVSGVIKSVSADTGALTVTVKSKKDGAADKSFTVNDTTAVSIIAADGTTKALTGKDGLKDPAVSAGAHVAVVADASGLASKISIGKTAKKDGKGGKGGKKK
jgi:hypothetical protein